MKKIAGIFDLAINILDVFDDTSQWVCFQDYLPERLTFDVQKHSLEAFKAMCLAQMQECVIVVSIKGEKKPSLIAQLCMGASSRFEEAIDLFKKGLNDYWTGNN